MDFYQMYTLEDKALLRFTDNQCGIDLSFNVYYTVKYSMRPGFGKNPDDPDSGINEDILKKEMKDEIQAAYVLGYPNGISMEEFDKGKPSEEFVQKLQEELNTKFRLFFGPEVETIAFEKQWIPEDQRKLWDDLHEAKRNTDPVYAAKKLRQAMDDLIAEAESKKKVHQWICSCGETNTSKFCPQCGAPRSYNRWICFHCGTENKGNFCTECGTPLKP